MPFGEVPARVDFVAQEREILKLWRETGAFEKLLALHENDPHWSFIDGPMTANNPMGLHHGWGRTYKDVFQRFWAMRGHKLRYQNGFDCQGLWVEVEVEKELGFRTKKDIEEYGLERFVRKCKERVLRYAAVQTEQSIRLGYWMDWDDPAQLRRLADLLAEEPARIIEFAGRHETVSGTVEQIVGRLGLPEMGHSYFTFSTENNVVIWTFLKKCWEKGWVYRGADVMPWCPRCATGISQHEIVTDGYAERTHASVTLRFPLRGREREALLVWTTTPWTLTSNIAAAVGADLTYVKVRQGEWVYYLSKGCLHMLKGPYEVLAEIPGRDMAGWTYDGPFDELPAAKERGGHTSVAELVRDVSASAAEAHRVLLWDQVGESEGTGIVHIATGCGAEDFALGRENGLPIIAPLDDEGVFVEGFGWLTGQHVSEVAQPIFADLERKGLLYRVADYTHRYPTCWRCKTDLVFRLVEEWFIRMGEVYDKPRETLTAEEKAASLRYQIMDVVDQIRWIPEFGHARELDWLRNMHDWMISKKRYWGLALPIWTCGCGHYEVVGDLAELKERAVAGWDVLDGHTPHRPYIDAVKIACPSCGATMSRVPDVGNPWLDAGVVPFSTIAWRTDPDYWRQWYPARWISESFPGQFRNWFYSLLAMATVLDGTPPFLQNFGYATLLAEDGQEMHKSAGNAIEFNEAADKMGVDVMRWLYCAHRPESNLLFGYHRADEVRRLFLIPLWNVYSFFVTYARLDNWEPRDRCDQSDPSGAPQSANPLDRWIVGRLNQVVGRVTEALENSDPCAATSAVELFLDDLSNWYVRRSRRRFWRSELDADKEGAYATLYHVLVKLCRLLAPFVPFVTETMYQNLVVGPLAGKADVPESIHHCAWPQVDAAAVDEGLLAQMALARQVAGLGLSARNAASLKVRQPLSRVLIHAGDADARLSDDLAAIVLDELNVKELEFVEDAGRLVSYKLLPDLKLLGPRLGKLLPKVRAALASADAAGIAARVQAGVPVALEVDGESIELAPEEILVQTQPAEGLAVAADKRTTVAIETTITPELRAEGLAREVVRRVQSMRKNAGFRIEDRITTYYQAGDGLAAVMSSWGDTIRSETLSTSLVPGPAPEGAHVEEHEVEGEKVVLGVRRDS